MNPLNLALDPGFGGFKTAFINGHGPEAFVLPSVVGAGALHDSGLSTGLRRGRKQDKPHTIQFNGLDYLVGANVYRHTRPVERMDFDRLADGPELRALTYTALWQALGDGDHYLNLLVGLPVEVQEDKDLAKSTLTRLRAWLVGEHEFKVDGQITSLTIQQVKAMAQPLGAFFEWGANEGGQWVQRDDPQAQYAIGDLGFNTFDRFVIEGAQVVARYSGGEKLGLRRTASFIRKTIRERFSVDISLHQADDLMRQHNGKKPVKFHHANGSDDISPIIDQGLDDNFGQIATDLEDSWGNGNQFRRIFFPGGGANAMADRLLRLYPQAVILGQTANATGLAKFAQRKNVFRHSE